MSEKVEVVLTFDDGPDLGHRSSQSKTRMVMNALDSRGIRGVFFIQSHAQDNNGNYYRGNTPTGRQIIADMIADGHIVGVHTGLDGKGAHTWVNRHTNRHPIDLYDDLVRAKDLINDEGGTAEFVRAPFGVTNKDVIDMYSALHLEYVHWDVAPEGHWDGKKTIFAQTAEEVQVNIRRQIKNQLELIKLKKKKPQIVVLFHDIQDRVAYHIESHIEEIEKTIKRNGFTPDMHPSKRRMEEILRAQSSKN